MANYNVGNIEVGAIVNDSKALSQLEKLENKIKGLSNVNINLGGSSSSISNISTQISSLASSIKGIFNFGKIYVAINYLKRFISYATKMVAYASDYAEALNKFEVSFGKLTEENLEFVEKLSKAYGLSKLTIMEYTSTFNNMLKALGQLSDDVSAKYARTLTQMAIDYSSLFNVPIDSAMKAFQSVLAGSVRPIRSASGFDVSETTIFAIYQQLGGSRSMRQLNQLEKRLLRIIAIQQQMTATGAIGDYQRTIESFSNQTRILKEQVTEFGSTWGKIILYYIKPAIQWINGLMIALNEVGDVITKNLLDNGVDLEEEFASLEGGIEGVTEEVESLNSGLDQLGLDELNIIGGGKATGVGSVEDIIGDAVSTYKTDLDNFSMRAKEISKAILSWAGYTYDADGNLVNAEETTEGILDNLKIFGISIGSGGILAGLIAAMPKIISGAQVVGKILSKIGGLFSGPIGWIITAVVVAITKIIEMFKNKAPAALEWIESLKNVWDEMLVPAWNKIKRVFTQIFNTLKSIWDDVIGPIATMVGDVLFNVIIPALGFVLNAVASILDFVMPFITVLTAVLTPILRIILTVIRNIVNFINNMIQAIIRVFNLIVDGIFSIINPIIDFINKIISKLNSLGKSVPDWLGGGWEIAYIDVLGETDTTEELDDDSRGGTFREALRHSNQESILPVANAVLQGQNEIVKAIKRKNTNLIIDGKQLAETTYDYYLETANRKG